MSTWKSWPPSVSMRPCRVTSCSMRRRCSRCRWRSMWTHCRASWSGSPTTSSSRSISPRCEAPEAQNRSLAQRNDLPAALDGLLAQHRIRIDGDGFPGTLQQRQIVEGVAVEHAVLHAQLLPGWPPLVVGLEPVLQTTHLACLEAGDTLHPAGIIVVDEFQVGGDEIVNAQTFRYRSGDEVVGGGDDQAIIAVVTVLLQQRLRLGQHHCLHAAAHELLLQGFAFGAGHALHGADGEVDVGQDVEISLLIELVEVIIPRLVGHRVHKALADEEFPPGMVAVAVEQGVVEIENRQGHVIFSVNAAKPGIIRVSGQPQRFPGFDTYVTMLRLTL